VNNAAAEYAKNVIILTIALAVIIFVGETIIQWWRRR
jgi:hypothetical protein